MLRAKTYDDFSQTLPALQTTWSSNSLGTFKECPRKYFYQKVRGLRPKHKSIHLNFGSYYAEAVETYHKVKAQEGADHTVAVRAAVRATLGFGERKDGTFTPWNTDDPNKNRATLVRAVTWYLDQFEHDPAKTIILANGQPAVELEFKFGIGVASPDGNEFCFSGFLDRLARFGDETFVMDNKTTKSTMSDHYFKQFSPNNQMSLYPLAGKIAFGAEAKGVIIDAVQLAVGFARFARQIIYRTNAQLDEWLAHAAKYLTLASVYAQESTLIANPIDAYPMNDTACDKFGGCPFRSICSADPGVRELYLNTDFEKRTLEPILDAEA